MNNKYSIVDINKFIETTRVMVYNSFGQSDLTIDKVDMDIENLEQEERQELDVYLGQKEAQRIIFEYIKKRKTKNGDTIYILSEEEFLKIINDLTLRLTSNLLNNLATRGLINTAFDEETNDFIFWAKEDGKNADN